MYSHPLKQKFSEYNVYSGKHRPLYLNFSKQSRFLCMTLIFMEYDFTSLNYDTSLCYQLIISR
jgi:hypothetical protein